MGFENAYLMITRKDYFSHGLRFVVLKLLTLSDMFVQLIHTTTGLVNYQKE